MFVLKNLFRTGKRSKSELAGPETLPGKMSLEERMWFRRKMLYEAITVTMQAHGILSASYRFRVVRNDRRGHRYLVLVDLSTDFLHNREGRPGQLVALGATLTKNAAARYGITVSAVYWQVNTQIQGFETSRPDAQHSGGGAEAPGLPLSHRKRDQPTAEEFAAFEAAWQEGHALQLGNRVYLSDLAPLGGGSERE